MKNQIKDKRTDKSCPAVYNKVDSHKWANQMEIRRLTSSKPDEEVKATLRKNRNCIP
jgi:hypothetical protein